MNPNYLDFEQPIADLEAKIQDLRQASTGPGVNIDAELRTLQDKLRLRTAQIFRDLSSWQVSQLARHPARPYTNDYIRIICDEFQELAGDRAYADDAAIVGGIGRINGRTVELSTYDSALFATREAVIEACNADLFALVGTGSVFDSDGAAASVHAATAPRDALGPSGGYIDRNAPTEASPVVTDELAAELWRRSEAWVH